MGKSHSKQSNSVKEKKRVEDPNMPQDVDLAVRKAVEAAEDEELSSMVKICVSAKNLGKSGHYCVVGHERVGQEPWEPFAYTEVSPNEVSPTFARTLATKYYFESPQKIRLYLYRLGSEARLVKGDQTKGPALPQDAVMVSSVDFPLAQVIAGVDSSMTLKLAPKGELEVVVEEVKKKQTRIKFNVRFDTLESKALSKMKSPKKISLYVAIHRTVRDAAESGAELHRPQVYRSETKSFAVDKSGLIMNAEWKDMCFSMISLSGGEPMIELWADNAHGDDQLVGSARASLKDIEAASKETDPTLKFSMEGVESTIMMLENVEIDRQDSFMDYVAGGLDMSLFVAIDFTKSNKGSGVPGSLHNFQGEDENDYVKAIRSIVDILQHYDSDKLVPVYGFGARLPPSYTHCSHCFACNGDYFNPEVSGMDSIIKAYKSCLESVILHGPTNFHQIVRLVADYAEPFADPGVENQRYAVLLILTDGVITDMKQTINEVVRAADFPMSIVIVGVGDEDFGLMKMLDGDDQRLYSTEERRFAARDIVQFVPFNKYKNGPLYQLAAETLAEIPREVVGYFSKKNMFPKTDRANVVAAQVEEALGEQSDLVKQLESVKIEFIGKFLKDNPDMDEFEVYKILNEDKTPSIDPVYFTDLVHKGQRGENVFETPRPTTPDTKTKQPFGTSSLAKSALPGSAGKLIKSSSGLKRATTGGSPTRSINLLDFNDPETPVENAPEKRATSVIEQVVRSPSSLKAGESAPVIPFDNVQNPASGEANTTPEVGDNNAVASSILPPVETPAAAPGDDQMAQTIVETAPPDNAKDVLPVESIIHTIVGSVAKVFSPDPPPARTPEEMFFDAIPDSHRDAAKDSKPRTPAPEAQLEVMTESTAIYNSLLLQPGAPAESNSTEVPLTQISQQDDAPRMESNPVVSNEPETTGAQLEASASKAETNIQNSQEPLVRSVTEEASQTEGDSVVDLGREAENIAGKAAVISMAADDSDAERK